MEKSRTRKYSLRAGLTLALAWVLIAIALFGTTAADTSGSAGEFSWTFEISNQKGAGDVQDNDSSEGKLSLKVGAKPSKFEEGSCGGSDTPAAHTTTTVTVTNNSGGTIHFDSIDFGGCTASLGAGDYLEKDASFKIYFTATADEGTGDQPWKTGTITITYSDADNIEVVFYGADNASYTYGNETLSSTTDFKTVEVSVGGKISLPSVSATSGNFLGWRLSHDGSLHTAGEELTVKAKTAVYPVVVDEDLTKPFTVGTTEYYFWTDAVYAAVNQVNSADKLIVLNQDYTLPTTMVANGVHPSAGSRYVTGSDGNVRYIVPNGVVFLIPFDANDTLYTNAPGATNSGYAKPTFYRTLKMVEGAEIIVQGAVSLSAMHSAKQGYNGSPVGECSRIEMDSGSSITVQSGGNLYAWGFITGAGKVTIESGGTVYETFQVTDYRGGDVTSKITTAGNNNITTYRVFPMSQYYVQNIEVPLELQAGAFEKVYFSVDVSVVGIQHATIPFVGSDGLFKISEGSVTKDYIEAEDRLEFTVDGKASMGSFAFSIKVSMLGGVTIASSDYNMSINSNITVNLLAGSELTIGQDLAFLPGAVVNISGGAVVTVAAGKSIFAYDQDSWDNFCFSKKKLKPVPYAPGKLSTVTRTESSLVDATICVNGVLDASNGYLYTTTGGANIYSTHSGTIKITGCSDTVTYQLKQEGSDGKQLEYVPISVTSAILQNSVGYDPATQATAGAAAGTVYGYDGLKWYIPNATLNDLTVEYRLDDYLWLNAYFTLNDIDVTQADVTNKVLTVNNGAELYVTNGKVYLVKKIPADQIPDDQTCIVTYNNGTAQVTAPFSANLTDLRAKDTTDEKTKTLIDKLLVYGDAAKLYFGNGKADSKLPLDLTGLPDREKAKDANDNYVNAETVGSGTDKLLSIKGMNVLFEERLSLMVAIQLKKDTTLYGITSLGSGNVAQIGLLVGEKDGGVLTVDNLGTYGKAYILYGNSNIIASDNVPVTEKDLPVYQAANKETTDWNNLVDDEGRTVIYLDLKSSAYTSSFELRPFVILKDGTVMYAAQYEYGLGAYIKSILSKENLVVPEGKDANAFRNLLVRTWEYALAADLCF